MGAACSAFLGVGIPYVDILIRGSFIAVWTTTPAALFLFFLLVGIVNAALRTIHRKLSLDGPELVVVYIMMIVATTIPSRGMTGFLLPIVSSPLYYATPENDWANTIQPYFPDWMGPQSSEGVKYFYEGLPKGADVPWNIWIRPLLCWVSLLLSLYFVMICVMVILRKQWAERERLIYPMVQVPAEMIEEDRRGSRINPFFKRALMWIGFAIPFIVTSVNALHNYYPPIPPIRLNYVRVPLFRNTVTLLLHTSFPIIGFSYLINLDIAFGLWFFHLVNVVEQGIFNTMGIGRPEPALGPYSSYMSPIIIHQAMGAMIVLVLSGLWIARGHLRDVFRKAWKGDPSVDDSDEILSYRTAVFGGLIGLIIIGVWLNVAGLPAWIVPLFLFAAFVLFITVTRIIVEGGAAAMFPPMNAPDFIASGVGTPLLGPTGLIALGSTYIWATDILIFLMPSCANGLKLADRIRGRKRLLFWAMMLAIGIAIVTSVVTVLKLSYRYGGINLDRYYYGYAAHYPFDWITGRIISPSGPNLAGWLHTGVGALIMGLLIIVRHRFLWWPLHPLGFPVSCVFSYMWFGTFVAWLIKSAILKYGGPKVYRSTRPFFLGLILGQFVAAGVWVLIDYFTGMTDNRVYTL